MELAHIDCPNRAGIEAPPALADRGKKLPYAKVLACELCGMIVAVSVLKEPVISAESAEA